jgi:hypothetical protein
MPNLTSRKQPVVERPKPFRDARLIVIACEGEKTEKQYFELFLRDSRVTLEVLETTDGKSDPAAVLKRLTTFKKKKSLQARDELWLVADTDSWGGQEAGQRMLAAEAEGISRGH